MGKQMYHITNVLLICSHIYHQHFRTQYNDKHVKKMPIMKADRETATYLMVPYGSDGQTSSEI